MVYRKGEKKKKWVNRPFLPSQNMHTGPNFSNFNIKALINDKVFQVNTCAATDYILLKRNSRSSEKNLNDQDFLQFLPHPRGLEQLARGHPFVRGPLDRGEIESTLQIRHKHLLLEYHGLHEL